MQDSYRYVLIQTYVAHGEQSKHQLRARPLPGQGLSNSMRVECSAKMREAYPPGTIFKVTAKIKDTDREPHVYTSWQWQYEVVSPAQAAEFTRRNQWDAPSPKK
jgi:hypothetical protein